MRRRSLILIAIVAVLVVAGAAGGAFAAVAQGGSSLPTLTPSQVITRVAEQAPQTSAISGDITWKNNLLGLSMLSFGGQGAGDLTSLLTSGEGRVWAQDGKLRAEIQGTMGDTVITADSATAKLWVYSSGKNTAVEYSLPAKQAGNTESTGPSTGKSTADLVTTIDAFIQKMAPNATLAVSDATKVAGRDCYVLSLIPKAENTLFDSAQVAIDSETYVPLKLDLYAKGTADPVLTVGFTKVSYATIDAGVFTFTPPAGATVQHKELALPVLGDTATSPDQAGASASGEGATNAKPAKLTLAEAAAKAGFTLAAAQTSEPALAFAGAYVIPAKQLDLPALLSKLGSGFAGAGALGGATSGDASSSGADTGGTDTSGADTSGGGFTLPPALSQTLTSGAVTLGPTVIQQYGQGFGSILLVEMKAPAQLTAQVEQLLGSVPLVSRTTVGGTTIYHLDTALSSTALWSKDGLLFVAAGSVSETYLMEFIASVR